MSAMATPASSTLLKAAATDLPFLSVFKDGELVESLCLHGLDSIVLGRHTNCDLIVTHPSVSRHHLEIQVLHGSRELLLTDLDSIHGTWINGNQALPLVSVMAKEGDSIKLGASSRTYSVQWRPHPPQNSTSSEDYSDNSASPLDCKDSKEHGAAESRTTMESCKPSQMDSGKTLEPACSTKSNSFCADNQHKDEEPTLREDEPPADSLDYDRGVCITKEKTSFNCEDSQENADCLKNMFAMEEGEVKIAAEPLAHNENACISREKSIFDCEELQDKVQECVEANNPRANLQSSMEKGEKLESKEEGVQSVTDQACFDGGNGGENVDLQVANHLSMLELEKASPALSKPCFDGRDGGENLEFQEAKHLSASAQESDEANPALSKLWLRRSRLNPPPPLLTSTSACSPVQAVPLPLQETHKNSLLPSAPPMPLSYLINNVVPSAPPLPPPGKLMTTASDDKCRAVDNEPITDDFECDASKENDHPPALSHQEMSGDTDYYECDDSKENHHPSVLSHQERSGEVAPNSLLKPAEMSEDYVSDKENDSPVFVHGWKYPKTSKKKAQEEGLSHERSYSASTEASRRPFQPLILTADGGCKLSSPCFKNTFGEENSGTQIKRPSPVVQNLDLMLRKLKGMARSEPRRAWHIVVDISCFLDSSSFKSLRQLEGFREVRLIIPKIVISELDYRRGIGRPRRKALKWIESCMVKLPSWIHVQSSSENLPAAVTPPVSPLSVSSIYGGSFDSMLSPTNGDHVLNCALLFNNTVFSGQVALLTNDIALKIKAMAEGLVCESPSTFCDSLLSPYSGRFLWATSIAHGHSWAQNPCHLKSSSALAPSVLSADQSPKEAVISTVKAMAFRKHHVVESLKKQCCKQPYGLRVALAN